MIAEPPFASPKPVACHHHTSTRTWTTIDCNICRIQVISYVEGLDEPVNPQSLYLLFAGEDKLSNSFHPHCKVLSFPKACGKGSLEGLVGCRHE